MAKKSILLTLWIVVILYVLCIDLKGIWTDEGNRFTLLSGGQTWQQFNQRGEVGGFADVITAVGPTSYQPLYYLIGNAIIRAAHSRSDVLLRLVNVLWLLAALQGLLRFFRGYSVYTRLFGILILALNGYMLMHVMQVREYPMYVALMIWSSCLCFEVLETPGPPHLRQWWGRLAAYGVSMALLFYGHVYCVFALAAQGIMLLARKENRAAFLRGLAFAYAVAAALVIPWLVTIYIRFPNKVDPGIWDRRPATFTLLYDSLIIGFRSLLTYGFWTGAPLMQVFATLILAGIPLAWLVTLRRREALDRRAVYALLTMLFFAAFQVFYFFKSQPLSVWPRYFIAYFAGYAILATCAFSILERHARQSSNPIWKAAAAAVFLLAGTAGAAQVFYYRADPYMDTGMSQECNWRVTTRSMIRYIRPDETIAYYYPLQAWTMSVYYPFYPHELSYDQILDAKSPGVPALWILDTGVAPDFLRKVMDRLGTIHYGQTRVVDIGCQCKLLRYELDPNAPRIHTLEAAGSGAIVVRAPQMRAGNAIVDKSEFGAGTPVVRSAATPTWAEFTVEVPAAGAYELRARCASQVARPVTVSLNGQKLPAAFCPEPTGGYYAADQRWQTTGTHDFPQGTATLRLESPTPFPHISEIAVIPVKRR